MYFHSMKAQHLFQRIGELTLVKESFAFEVDLDGWKDYMTQQGHTRLAEATRLSECRTEISHHFTIRWDVHRGTRTHQEA